MEGSSAKSVPVKQPHSLPYQASWLVAASEHQVQIRQCSRESFSATGAADYLLSKELTGLLVPTAPIIVVQEGFMDERVLRVEGGTQSLRE